MKFLDQRTDPIINFGTLSNGELFLSDGHPFLKVKPIGDYVQKVNAIDLTDGEPYFFDDGETIEKVWECELVVKG